MDFKNRNVLVLGLQKSGKAAIRLLKQTEAYIFTSDEKGYEVDDGLDESTTFIPYQEVVGRLKEMDLIVKSPGIPYDIPILKEARLRKILIISEIELAYQLIDPGKVLVGITGTNGKTTTTSLITKILNDNNVKTKSVGNIGYSLSDAIIDHEDADVFVIELSSFQLLDIIEFCPHVAVLLNLSEAHLDYHHTYKHYTDAKFNLLKNMREKGYVIYNWDDPLIKRKVKKVKAVKYSFSLYDNHADCYVKDGQIEFKGNPIMKVEDLKLLGTHNLYNALASVTIAKALYIENEGIRRPIMEFQNLPHRIQWVQTIREVNFYNDSKSTNPQSTICALDSFSKPVILILGGLDRHQSFKEVIHHPHVKFIIAYGQTKQRIFGETISANVRCLLCSGLKEAVDLAFVESKPLDIVLFSPGCASWDQFESYEARGEIYMEFVHTYVKKDLLL